MGNHQIRKLMSKYNAVCHYCKRMTDGMTSGREPTRDHIVPKAFGGPNHIDNYVLACLSCNNDRGTMLFYCKCRDCTEKILDALYDPISVGRIFNGIVDHNKPKLRKNQHGWGVRIGHNKKFFTTFDEAVEFATTGTFVKDRDYDNN